MSEENLGLLTTPELYQKLIVAELKYEKYLNDNPDRRFSEEELQNIVNFQTAEYNRIEEELISRGYPT
jgi:hypothetical protein